ncbi:MAG: hypothetical protein V1929_11735 [bacterium]
MQNVLYFGPLDTAFAGTKRTLFAPFDLGKWFALGFSAWLAMLGEQGGSFNLPLRIGKEDMGKLGAGLGDVVRAYLPLIITIGVIGAVIGIALIFVLAWLNARGKFMLLDNVIADRSLVAQPWTQFRAEGNSLFGWMVVYGLAVLTVTLLLIGAGIAAAWPSLCGRVFDARALITITTVALLFLIFAIAMAYIQTFLVDFVVPLMWKYHLGVMAGWRRFGELFRTHRGTFILYGLMRLLIGIGAGTAIALAGLLTCCCGFVLLLIPYVNAVCLLPITVFTRLYSLEFLRQFGAEYNVFATALEPPALPEEKME